MRTKILLAACTVFALALVGAYQGSAQEPPTDLGETNLLVLACNAATTLAEAEGLVVRYCRRYAPEEGNGWQAKATVKVSTSAGIFIVGMNFQKSLWSVHAWTVTQV